MDDVVLDYHVHVRLTQDDGILLNYTAQDADLTDAEMCRRIVEKYLECN